MLDINENTDLNNTDTKYIIETIDQRKLLLYLNARNMALTLHDLISWYRDIYNNKDYGQKILYNGKLYSEEEWFRLPNDKIDKNDLDQYGNVKSGVIKRVYLREDIENKLEEHLSDIKDFINKYMGW